MEFDGMIINYHKDYSSNMKFIDLLKGTGFLDVDRIEVFRVNLRDQVRFIPLSFSLLTQSISLMNQGKASNQKER